MPNIYGPEEDSYLLQECIKKFLKKRKVKSVLDMGSVSGIQAQTFVDSGIPEKNIIVIDINKDAIKHLKLKFKNSKVIHSDLFSKIKGKFDLIVFNPPYLPENKFDKNKDTSGGKLGNETAIRFLNQAQNHLNKNGAILLVVSSFTPKIDFPKLGYKKKVLLTKKIFYEELSVLELNRI